MANRVRPIEVSAADRADLERLHRASSTPAGLSRRARAVLLMTQGLSGSGNASPGVRCGALLRHFLRSAGAWKRAGVPTTGPGVFASLAMTCGSSPRTSSTRT